MSKGERHLGGPCLGLDGVGESAKEARDPWAGAALTSREAARNGEGDLGHPAKSAAKVRPSGANVLIAGDDPR